jgi:CRP-like cAMP-binding protein
MTRHTFQTDPLLFDALGAICSSIDYPKGTIVFEQGRPAKGVYIVLRGTVMLWLKVASGRQVPFRTAGPGCIMGLPASISGRPYSLGAKVVRDARIGFVPRKQLLELLRKDSQHCYRVVEILSDEVSMLRRESARVQPR